MISISDLEPRIKTVLLSGSESVGEVADRMSASATDVIQVGLKEMGLLLTVTDQLERPVLEDLAGRFGFRVRWFESSGS